MIYKEEAKFYDLHATALVKLSNGKEALVETALDGEGLLSDWWESPTGYPEHGSVHYQECDMDEHTIKATYPDEFIYIETGKEGEVGVVITDVIEVKRVDWQLDEESLEC